MAYLWDWAEFMAMALDEEIPQDDSSLAYSIAHLEKK
jgi:hypothetical protein